MGLSSKTLQGNFDPVQYFLLNWQPQIEAWPSPFLSALSPFFCRPFLSSINWMWRDSSQSSLPSFIQHCLPLLLTINAIRIGSRAKIRTRRRRRKFLTKEGWKSLLRNFLRRSTYAECGCCKRDNSLNIPPHMREPACYTKLLGSMNH